MSLLPTITRCISDALGRPVELADPREVGGGCINRTLVVQTRGGEPYFVKLNDAARLGMFEAEAEGLRELAAAKAVRVPQPLCSGRNGAQAFLVMEHVALAHDGGQTQPTLGRQLAVLHRVTRAQFGWQRDNTLGATTQLNAWHDDWVTFYRERRLRYQFDLATARGGEHLQRLGEDLLERLPTFFSDYRPRPSLLHGDLWSGNAAASVSGEPVIFDPAVYFGDREADLAMTELFGGFSARFYDAYREAWPLDPGYATRKTLYNLYHVLNHFNLFGGGYAAQAEHMLRQLLSEVR